MQRIDFLYNVQHDCSLAKCTASGKRPVMQERVESGLLMTYIEHRPCERFIINTHAFHNAHLLRSTLPRSLVAPIPLFQNRQTKHIEMARNLRETQQAKRTATKARATQKRQDTINAAGPPSNKRMRSEMEDIQMVNFSGHLIQF